MKKYIALLTAFLVFGMFTLSVQAHSSFIPSRFDSHEQAGWKVNENQHVAATTVNYMFEAGNSDITAAIKTSIRGGEWKWRNYCNFVEVSVGSYPLVQITTIDRKYEDENGTDFEILASTIAKNTVTSTGHATYWQIAVNLAYEDQFDMLIAGHEFGHVIGLADLYNSRNSSKLMYGYKNASDKNVSSADGNGARVILGTHSSHTMGTTYSQVWDYPSSVPAHISFCTNCNIADLETCTPQTGTCTKCKKTH